MRTILFCSVAGVLLTLVLAESSSSPQSSSSAQGKHQQQQQQQHQQQHQQQASSKSEGQLKAEDKSDHDAVAQPATSYSTVVYHDPPPQDGGGGEGAAHSARVTKAAALGDIAAPAGAESTATFRLYHPKLEDYMSNMNPALVQNLMKQQPQTFAKIEQHKSDSSGPVAQAATKLLYPPKKYKSVMPGSQQTAFNVGYSIGFGGGGGSSDGGGGGSRQPHPQALVGHEEVVTGKPKLRVRVEGKNSVWKQLSPNVEMSSQHASASSIGQGRYAFDHDQALGQSNTFDASNAVEDPLQLHQLQPLAMPLTFPLPLAAFDNVFIPPLPLQQQQQQQQQQQTSSRAVAPGQFRTGHALQLKPSDSPLDAKPLASLHSVHTLLPQVPSSMYVLKPPSPEKASSGSEPSFSYQMYEHSPQSQPQPPKYRTIVQLRPVQTGGVGGVVSGLIPGLRPSRDLAGEQTVLNAILSQELLRKNSAARNAPIIAQTVYGVRSYR
ncbi:hypothetical protein LSTR_LSTR009281 [Laodelphax striatellus]|uniref:Uncharacterized protein n=1 Tax=Laodelphax striatellus TaxID=195883 RepID=A0A482XMA0_LAOST|nr:hypothetical protein LSTR_LSTR009281 [Laodelphax striatellus]